MRKDEIELVERGLYIESWLPERRSRRKPLLFVHGELGGSWVWERYLHHFAGRGWEGHALNLRNHFWSQTADPGDARHRVLHGGRRRRARAPGPERGGGRARAGRPARAQGDRAHPGLGLRPASRPSCRGRSATPRGPHVVRDVPDAYGRSALGWETLPEKLQREHRDLSHPATSCGSSTCSGRSRSSPGGRSARSSRACPSTAARCPTSRGWSSPAASTPTSRRTSVERLAEWLDAPFEPFGAHSHYGLVLGEQSYLQVAETLRAFLETNRL